MRFIQIIFTLYTVRDGTDTFLTYKWESKAMFPSLRFRLWNRSGILRSGGFLSPANYVDDFYQVYLVPRDTAESQFLLWLQPVRCRRELSHSLTLPLSYSPTPPPVNQKCSGVVVRHRERKSSCGFLLHSYWKVISNFLFKKSKIFE